MKKTKRNIYLRLSKQLTVIIKSSAYRLLFKLNKYNKTFFKKRMLNEHRKITHVKCKIHRKIKVRIMNVSTIEYLDMQIKEVDLKTKQMYR